jgi:HK97 family phage major capsid protein
VNTNMKALADKVEALRAEIVDLDAVEAPTEEQVARFDAAIAEHDTARAEYDAAVARAEKVEAVRAAAVARPDAVERAFHAPEVIVKRSPFDGLDADSVNRISSTEAVSRAATVIEQTSRRGVSDAALERATELAEGNSAIARHILMTGSPEYVSAFEKVMRFGPEGAFLRLSDVERAALSNTSANGGYTNPWLLDPTIILTNDGVTNPLRGLATVVTGTTDKWNGITSAGVTAEWLGEGSAAADATPTVGQPSITAIKGSAYIFGSYEQEADGQLVSQLPMLIADAKDRLEAAAFATGAGSTSAPEGVVTGVTAITASRVSPTTGGTFTSASLADVFAVANALTPRSAGTASWIANKKIFNLIRQAAAAQNSANSVWTDFAMGTPSNLLGQPAYEASSMTGTVTTGSNILLAGDFKAGFYVYDRVGVEMRYLPVVTDTSTGRPTGQAGWFAFWRVGSKVVDPNAFRVLKL